MLFSEHLFSQKFSRGMSQTPYKYVMHSNDAECTVAIVCCKKSSTCTSIRAQYFTWISIPQDPITSPQNVAWIHPWNKYIINYRRLNYLNYLKLNHLRLTYAYFYITFDRNLAWGQVYWYLYLSTLKCMFLSTCACTYLLNVIVLILKYQAM